MRNIKMAAAALCLASGLGYADVVTFQGTAAGFLVTPTGYLTKIGYNLHPGGSFRFSGSYQTNPAPWPGTGAFKLESLGPSGEVLDTIDLKPTPMYDQEIPFAAGHEIDEFVLAAQGHRNGVLYQVTIDLDDPVAGRLAGGPGTYLNQTWPQMIVGLTIQDPACEPHFCYGYLSYITSLSAIVTPGLADTDGDGVPDSLDKCPGSSGGAVNGDGCTIAQLVPCSRPAGGGSWKNHGQYVSNVAKAAQSFVSAGLITEDEKDAMVAAAAGSSCP